MANAGVLGVQRTVKDLSGAVPGIFSKDAGYIPLVYKMLQNPLFGLSAQESLHMVEKCFCQEHEGFHIAAKYHQRALSDNLKYLEGLDYLWPVNRDLRIMASASIGRAIQNNVRAFKRFSRDVATSR